MSIILCRRRGRRAAGGRRPTRFFSKARIIARPGFNRWLVPPAALAIHLCIGMAYGFSVFWLPLSQALGGGAARACPAQMSAWQELFTTQCDWRISMLGWTYTLFLSFWAARRRCGEAGSRRRGRVRSGSSQPAAGAAD
ncbi:hypothetical protein O0544_06635 [Edwardsiella anguillarum]|nr:hypothetical protein [Edwardsiella anguillarum]